MHVYPGWYGTYNTSFTKEAFYQQFLNQVPVQKTNPIIVTEIDWSPEKPGAGHYNEFNQWVPANYGTWGTETTTHFGNPWKYVMDRCGNISMTLGGTGEYIDIDKYLSERTITRPFSGTDEACDKAAWEWYKAYYEADRGTGVHAVFAENRHDSRCYNLLGQRINFSSHGIIIRDGKKFINKLK